MSAIAVSDSNMFGGGTAACVVCTRYGGGVGLQPGVESKVDKAVYAISIFNLFIPSPGPLCQVTKSSQPLFFPPRTNGVDAGGSVDMAAWFAFLGFVFA